MDTSRKPFLTVDEQIQLLKHRGLEIPDESTAAKMLLSSNYYNIVNGYSKFFPMDGDTYTNGTTLVRMSLGMSFYTQR